MNPHSRHVRLITLAVALVWCNCGFAADGRNLVKNPDFEQAGAGASQAAHFALTGDSSRTYVGAAYEIASNGIALDSGRDVDGDGKHEGSVAQEVPIDKGPSGRWYRFQVRGLPEDGFAVGGDNLHMKADFFSDGGRKALDGVTRKIYPLVEQERKDLTVNGVRHQGGAATWKTYAFEFRMPFPEIDQVRLIVGFRDGKGTGKNARFLVDEFSLEAIPQPTDAPQAAPIRAAQPAPVDPSKLIALGGRWFYSPMAAETVPPGGKGLVVTVKNADRLLYNDGDGRYLNPFAENMSAFLKAGYLDLAGKLVEEDQLKPDNVTITFENGTMLVHARSLPNHPTSRFPSVAGSGDRNPNYIQEQDSTYYLPLVPAHNPAALAMLNQSNANRALPRGPIGFAVNGVVFFNPFDAEGVDATDLMDRCCGHPSPDNRYHYHKYPVCVKSPFADEGKEHSPLIGWAFDGYAIYGPYEGQNLMAKDAQENPLNEFNGHNDSQRGWHYHATPGKFPYIIGGYWGKVDPRNLRRGMMMGGPGFGPGRPGGPSPIVGALDPDHNREISAEEIDNAPTSLLVLDRDADGVLTREELQPPGGPGGRGVSPIIAALDKNRDGQITADEIEAAPAALRTLDKNGDRKLTPEEFRPAPPPGAPGR